MSQPTSLQLLERASTAQSSIQKPSSTVLTQGQTQANSFHEDHQEHLAMQGERVTRTEPQRPSVPAQPTRPAPVHKANPDKELERQTTSMDSQRSALWTIQHAHHDDSGSGSASQIRRKERKIIKNIVIVALVLLAVIAVGVAVGLVRGDAPLGLMIVSASFEAICAAVAIWGLLMYHA